MTYKVSEDFRPGQCTICKDGYPLVVDSTTGRRFHNLPEPVGDMDCGFQQEKGGTEGFDADLWMRAEKLLERECDQIYLYFYSNDPENLSKAGEVIVRNGAKGKTLYQFECTEENYDKIHEEASRVVRLAQLEAINSKYESWRKARGDGQVILG